MELIIGSEGMGVPWGKIVIEYLFKQLDINIKYQNTDNCDLIIKTFGIDLEKEWNHKPKKYIYWSCEAYIPSESKYQTKNLYITTIKNIVPNHLYVPYFLYSPHLYKNRISPNINRKYLLAYCNSHFVPEREYMYHLFVQKSKLCHALGNCCGTHPETKLDKINGDWTSDQLIKTYTNYKFVLAMENTICNGYITEKIINAFYSGAIPIYWGCNSVVNYFNPKSFIRVNDFNSFEECVNYILQLDEQIIEKMTQEPIYTNNEITHLIDDEWNSKNYNKTLNYYMYKLGQFIK
jgi:hypothetical protein